MSSRAIIDPWPFFEGRTPPPRREAPPPPPLFSAESSPEPRCVENEEEWRRELLRREHELEEREAEFQALLCMQHTAYTERLAEVSRKEKRLLEYEQRLRAAAAAQCRCGRVEALDSAVEPSTAKNSPRDSLREFPWEHSDRNVLSLLVREAYRSLRYYNPSAVSAVVAALGALKELPRDSYALVLSVLPTLPAFSNGLHVARLLSGLSQLHARHPMLTAHLLKHFLRCSFATEQAPKSALIEEDMCSRLGFVTSLAIVLRALHQYHSPHEVRALFDALDETLLSGRVLIAPASISEEEEDNMDNKERGKDNNGLLGSGSAMFFISRSLECSGGARRPGVDEFFRTLDAQCIHTHNDRVDNNKNKNTKRKEKEKEEEEEEEKRHWIAFALQPPRRCDRLDALLSQLRAVCPLLCRGELPSAHYSTNPNHMGSAPQHIAPSVRVAVDALLQRCALCIPRCVNAPHKFVLSPAPVPQSVAERCALRSREAKSSLRRTAAHHRTHTLCSNNNDIIYNININNGEEEEDDDDDALYDSDHRHAGNVSLVQSLVELAEWVSAFHRTFVCAQGNESVPSAATLQCVHDDALIAAVERMEFITTRAEQQRMRLRVLCAAGPLFPLKRGPHALQLVPMLIAEVYTAATPSHAAAQSDPMLLFSLLLLLLQRCVDSFACDPSERPLCALHSTVWAALSHLAALSPPLGQWIDGFRHSPTFALVDVMGPEWPKREGQAFPIWPCGSVRVVANRRNALLWALLLLACFVRIGVSSLAAQRAVAQLVQVVARHTPLLGRQRPAPESLVALSLREGMEGRNAEEEEVVRTLEEVLAREKEQVKHWQAMYPVVAESVIRYF